MYKRALSGLLAINLIFLIGVLSLCRMEEICRKLQQTVSEVHMEESLLADKESIMMGIASRTSSGQRVVDCSELQRESKYQLEQADLEVLLRIVEAEAGCRSDASPCYRCLFDEDDAANDQKASTLGIFSPLTGLVGTLQAAEALRLAAGLPSPWVGKLLMIDMLAGEFETVRCRRRRSCPVCGGH